MADNQRVYPTTVDIEKNAAEDGNHKPSAPLIPKSSLSSEKSGVVPVPVPVPVYPSSGRRISDQFPRDQVIPRPELPRYYSPPPKRRNSFCRCLCCTFCFLFVLIAIIAIAAAILYLVFQPRIPKYSVDSIQITNFSVNSDLSLNSQFDVKIRARNPNKKIGIYYLDNSYLAVSYSGKELCTGTLPAFYQGHKNTTVLGVTLAGSGIQITSDMISTLNEQRQQGSVPLDLRADVPVKIKLGKLKLMKIKFRVRCNLVVNRLDANADVSVSAKNCKLARVKL
jgi:hypothetical protein